MKLKRRVLAVLLTLAVMVTFMPFISQQAYAAGSSKVQVVTKAKANNGNTSYTYNKKGLVSKSVYKSSSKETDSDSTYTVTTAYKYNKKNKVSKKTKTEVEKVTYYDTDKTTEKIRTANLGTVTTTTKYVTVFTYNKKGLATKSVTTKTSTMSGSKTTESKSRSFIYEGYYDDDAYETTDGRILADYYYVDGKRTYTYWTGAVNDAVGDTKSTTTYADNGDGTYRVVSETTVTNANYDTNIVYGDGGMSSAEVVIKGSPSSRYTKTESISGGKTVTTTTYKYDKKKRVKAENSVSVSTTENTDVSYSQNNKGSDGSTFTRTSTTPRKKTETVTSSSTTTYTYDKKGHAKKVVTNDKGISNKTTVTVYGLTNISEESVAADSTRTARTWVSSGTECERIDTYVVAGGVITDTVDNKPYTSVYTENGVAEEPEPHVAKVETKNWTNRYNEEALSSKDVTKYTYDKNGNMKTAKETIDGQEYRTQKNETYGNSIYQFVDAENLEPDQNPYQYPEEVQVLVNHKTKYNRNFDSTVKNGTKRLDKKLRMSTSSKDGSSATGYDLEGRIVYTLKAKSLKSSLAKLAEQQQWAIQNGSLNGMVGF